MLLQPITLLFSNSTLKPSVCTLTSVTNNLNNSYDNLYLRGGVRRSPRRLYIRRVSYLLDSHCVLCMEPELTDCPPFSVEFWHNPNCHMNYSNYL